MWQVPLIQHPPSPPLLTVMGQTCDGISIADKKRDAPVLGGKKAAQAMMIVAPCPSFPYACE